MELTTLVISAIILLIVFYYFRPADPRLPPSPMRPLPIVGHLFHVAEDFRPQFKEWRSRCGDIYSLYMGRTLVVVLNGYDLIKEALVKKADIFSDRPPFYFNQASGHQETGVIFSSGSLWKEQRSVSLSILRDFGMGKNLLAEKIKEEVACYISYLASLKGKPADIRVTTNISTANIICSIIIGHRFDYGDKSFQKIMHSIGSLLTDQKNVALVNFIPWLSKLPGDLFRAKKIDASTAEVTDLLKQFINAKRRQVKNVREVDNLIDAYLLERKKKIEAGESTTLDDRNLTKVMFDLFVAGSDTTSATINWCLLYLLNNPDVQDKVFQEIKDKIGTDRTPTIQDKPHLTYLNAVIAETQRLASIAPLSVTHICSDEVTLKNYTLPKGTYVIPNLDSVHHDENTWGDDVMSFKPERFIDATGNLHIPDQLIPFSVGRRICLGQSIAKMELFLFLSSMFQRFKFLPPTPDSVPPLKYLSGNVIKPLPFEVRLVERQ